MGFKDDTDYGIVSVFRKRMSEKRTEAGLTMKALGERMGGLSHQRVWQIEKTGKAPSIVTADRVARALDTTVSELLKDDPQHNP